VSGQSDEAGNAPLAWPGSVYKVRGLGVDAIHICERFGRDFFDLVLRERYANRIFALRIGRGMLSG